MLDQKPQDNSFQDGVVKLYRKENTAAPGDMPKEGLAYKVTLRYRRRTVGMQRNYLAKQNQEHIDEVIRCPLVPSVCSRDIAELPGGQRYLIRQVQYPENPAVPVMDLALERLEGGGYGPD